MNNKTARYIIAGVLTTAALACGAGAWTIRTSSEQAASVYNEIAVEAENGHIDWYSLKRKNDDFKLYLQLGKDISYPVVQTTDNDYYLNHDFNKTANSAGCLFVDMNCQGLDAVIHGHSGGVGIFSDLLKFKDEGYVKEVAHSHTGDSGLAAAGYIVEQNGYKKELEIIAAYQGGLDEQATDMWMNFYKNKTVFTNLYRQTALWTVPVSERVMKEEISETDRLLVLSTCDAVEGKKDSRFMLLLRCIPCSDTGNKDIPACGPSGGCQ